jgi:hypothetical protein
VAVHPLTVHRVLDTIPASGWQVVHETNGLTVLLSGASASMADAKLVDELAKALATQGVYVPLITVQHVPTIPKTAAGKAPLIKSARNDSVSYVHTAISSAHS